LKFKEKGKKKSGSSWPHGWLLPVVLILKYSYAKEIVFKL
jgi:hypothetical protein